jgi:hypothetical protein
MHARHRHFRIGRILERHELRKHKKIAVGQPPEPVPILNRPVKQHVPYFFIIRAAVVLVETPAETSFFNFSMFVPSRVLADVWFLV